LHSQRRKRGGGGGAGTEERTKGNAGRRLSIMKQLMKRMLVTILPRQQKALNK